MALDLVFQERAKAGIELLQGLRVRTNASSTDFGRTFLVAVVSIEV